ncbi:hypothetical protein AAZX31_03G222000 [Glycine max]
MRGTYSPTPHIRPASTARPNWPPRPPRCYFGHCGFLQIWELFLTCRMRFCSLGFKLVLMLMYLWPTHDCCICQMW